MSGARPHLRDGVVLAMALVSVTARPARAADCPDPPDRDYSALERGILDDDRLAEALSDIVAYGGNPYGDGLRACPVQRDACRRKLEHHEQTQNEHDESALMNDIEGGWLGESYTLTMPGLTSMPDSDFSCDDPSQSAVRRMIDGRRAISRHHRDVITEWGRWHTWALGVARRCRDAAAAEAQRLEEEREKQREEAERDRQRQEQEEADQRRREDDDRRIAEEKREQAAERAQAKVQSEEATKAAGELIDAHQGVENAEAALAKVELHGVRTWQLELYPEVGFLALGLHFADWRDASGVDWLHFGIFGIRAGVDKLFWFAPPDPQTFDGYALELAGHAGIDTMPGFDEVLVKDHIVKFTSSTWDVDAEARLWLGAFGVGGRYEKRHGWTSDLHRDEFDFDDGTPLPAPFEAEVVRAGPTFAWAYENGTQGTSALVELRWLPMLHRDPHTFALGAEIRQGLLNFALEFVNDFDATEPGESWNLSLLVGLRAVGGPDTMEVEPPRPAPIESSGPDSDGDGVPDADDRCPNDNGPKENGGCPGYLAKNAADGLAPASAQTPAPRRDGGDFVLRGGLSPQLGVLGLGLAWRMPGTPVSLAAGTGTHVFGGGLSFDLFPLVSGWWPSYRARPYLDLHLVRIASFFAEVPTGWGAGATMGIDFRPLRWLSLKAGLGGAWTSLATSTRASPLAYDLAVGWVL